MRELSKERRRRRRMSLAGGLNEHAVFAVGSGASAVGDYWNVGHKEMKEDGEQIGPSQRAHHMNESTRDNNECEANEVTIPISTCLAVFFCYILLGSILFSWWEGWEYFEGSYFCFVSLVTIGFSDMVPGRRRNIVSANVDSKSNTGSNIQQGDGSGASSNISARVSAPGSNGREESLDHVDGQLILCSIYILFGMALMAMCFHLTQERFFTTAKKLGRALHLI
ncbi:Outward-rectifier potassium channel TOK1 [Orchesella cincta]|uniref:Outward-rectifier potassium channel TOK1 n=1 Tax=Orchesella cincta TaxID=48709 RepID=A0A1D2N0B8_ORCCI|nr:Outward-rectifier potassium channel TOK1 [Orchesella cincta]